MSRIQYRCWRPCEKRFHGSSNDDINWNTSIPFEVYEKTPGAVLQQCSGKQDRFGKWIFEGDILLLIAEQEEYTSHPDIKVKLFIDEDLVWMVEDLNQGARTWGRECLTDCAETESIVVIGNIFEGHKTDAEIRELFVKEDLENQRIWEQMEAEA